MTTQKLSSVVFISQENQPRLLNRLVRLLINILSSPKGDQGGWEGGVRGL
jgi:hypothetical protein